MFSRLTQNEHKAHIQHMHSMSTEGYSRNDIDGVTLHAQVSSMAWHIHLVEVVNLTTKVTWSFPCDRWLAMQRGEGVTLRDVYPLGHPKCLHAPMTDYQVSHCQPPMQSAYHKP